jgi:hypothetical protein
MKEEMLISNSKGGHLDKKQFKTVDGNIDTSMEIFDSVKITTEEREKIAGLELSGKTKKLAQAFEVMSQIALKDSKSN